MCRAQPLLAAQRHELHPFGIAEDSLRDASRDLRLEADVTFLFRGAEAGSTGMNADPQFAALSDALDRAVHRGHRILALVGTVVAAVVCDRFAIEGARNLGVLPRRSRIARSAMFSSVRLPSAIATAKYWSELGMTKSVRYRPRRAAASLRRQRRHRPPRCEPHPPLRTATKHT